MQRFRKKGYMHMRRFQAKGGYGEHGRSCFLVTYGHENRFYMVDCGIMDSDGFPYPEVTEEELRKTDYLFLTHCHKDHSGAFSYFREKGFSGWLVTSAMTLGLEKIVYDKVICLPVEQQITDVTVGPFSVNYGRSGHCPGGLWFRIEDEEGSCFFSGDYQEDTLLYACDKVTDMRAQLAVIDCAHNRTDMRAAELRKLMSERIRSILRDGKQVILPVPHFGRGIEMLYMLKREFPDALIRVDADFVNYSERMLEENDWYYGDALCHLNDILPKVWENAISGAMSADYAYDILLIADTHLKQEKNDKFVRNAVENGAVVMITGRVKAGSCPEMLLKEGKAERYLYPHHQSRGDLEAVIKRNHFGVVIPFHNDEKEILIFS